MTIYLPPDTTINVRSRGAVGDGKAIDSTVIQSLINANPYGILYFPKGLYRLHNNSFNQAGLLFSGFHGTAIMEDGGRFLCDTVTVGVSGQCIKVLNSTGASFDNFRVGYIGDQNLPWVRSNATNNAILVETSANVTFTNTTVESSTGSGIWVTGSTSVLFLGGTSVSNTTADGLHFENDGSSEVNGYTAQNTGDDALSATDYSPGVANCGLDAMNIQIFRSLSRGITVAGACKSSFSNFYIDTTANSGIGVGQDPNFQTRVPSDTTFTGGTIRAAGRAQSPVVSGKDCVDISKSVGTTITNVECEYPLMNGVFIDDAADQVAITGVTTDVVPNVGFQAVNATNISFKNTTSRNSLGGGYGLQQVNQGSVTGATACSSGGYGFYQRGATGFTESNLMAYDSSEGNPPNRAWWAEDSSSGISLTGIKVIDDKTAIPIVIGGATDPHGSVVITGATSSMTRSKLLIQLP